MTTLSSLLPPARVSSAIGTLPVANGGTGLTSPGTLGNVLTSNGTAWVSQTPAPSGPTTTAIASGSLSDGSTVIVNADGTVSAISAVAQAAGSTAVFESAATFFISATYDASTQRVVIAYQDQGNASFGTAVVGTVSGVSISFGTPVVFNSGSTNNISAVYDVSTQRIVIAYRNQSNSGFGTAIVGTVSGTSISFGTAVVFNSADTPIISAVYGSAVNKVIIAYFHDFAGRAIVGFVAGTTITFGNQTSFQASSTAFATLATTYDESTERFVVAFQNPQNSNFGTAAVSPVLGLGLSFATPSVFNSANTPKISLAYDSVSRRVVFAYQDTGNLNYGTVRVAAIVSSTFGLDLSFGSAVVFNSIATSDFAATYDANAERVVIVYSNAGNSSRGTAIVGTVSGTSISFGTPVVLNSTATFNIAATYDSVAQRVVAAYTNQSGSNFGTSVVFRNAGSTLTRENFVGISSGAYTNGQTVTIQLAGAIDDAQSGLTAGLTYYVQQNGSLATTVSTPLVPAGTAISATRIIVQK
jgi:hypothetical protein